MLTKQQILKHISRQPRALAGFKQLVRELGLRGEERRELDSLLHQMKRSGELVEIGRDKYALAMPQDVNTVTGRLSLHRDGYGFVLPDSAAIREKFEGDVFIPAHSVGNAMHGDRVVVELTRAQRGQRAEGRILKVAGRAHSTIVGIFHRGPKYNYVLPMDERLRNEIIIPPGAEIPESSESISNENSLDTPHRVIGREAHITHTGDLDGLYVDVELTQFPSPTQSARGKVIAVLGREDDFGVDVEIIIRKHHLPHVFPPEALEEAREQSPAIPAAELSRRRDFRNVPIVTIDGETARDFDDAVHVRRLDDGGYELQVHIADVAHFVREGTALDDEARLRSTSVYFPDRAVPMLPLELSTDLCSLRPHEDRLVLSCVMNLDRTGELTGYSLHEGVMRSAERMTYTTVQKVLDGDAPAHKQYSSHVAHFMLMKELAEVLNRRRMKRGSIDFDLPEPLIDFDEAGLVRGITRSERLFANRIIEEFMLAANECVASHLERRSIASLYRIHEKPDPKRIYEFEQLAATFGQSLGVGALPIQRFATRGDKRAHIGSGRRPQTIEIPQDVHITPRMYQKLAMKIAGSPIERILSFLMLRSLKQAKYSEQNEGHFALATPSYTHFTSPIRRYPDLIIHRILKEVLRNDEGSSGMNTVSADGHKPSPWSKRALDNDRSQGRRRSRHQEQIADQHRAERDGPIPERLLHDIAEETSQSERRAQDAERELMEWKKIKFMAARIGEEFDALIIGVNKFGLNVELTELFVEGQVPLMTMTSDHFTFRENTRQIIGERTRRTFSLGSKLRVLLDRIDHMERRLLFAVVDMEERPQSGGTSKGKRKKK